MSHDHIYGMIGAAIRGGGELVAAELLLNAQKNAKWVTLQE